MANLATPIPPMSSSIPPANLSSEKEAQTARTPLFPVKPSTLLKCQVVGRAGKISDIKQDDKFIMRLAADEFRARKMKNLHQSTRLRAAAEEEHSQKQREEANVLMYAVEKGFHWTSLEPQLALGLARAARDTIMAEQDAAKLRIKECEDLLETLKDSADDILARVQDANLQVGALLTTFDREAIRVDFLPQCFEPSFHVPDDQHHPRSPSDVEFFSGSDSKSVSELDQQSDL